MNPIHLTLAAAICMAVGALPTQAQAQASSAVQVKDWDVFVDPPTRFAFVKTPNGWVFVRQLDEEQMTRLPASTLTALLAPDEPVLAHQSLRPRSGHDTKKRPIN